VSVCLTFSSIACSPFSTLYRIFTLITVSAPSATTHTLLYCEVQASDGGGGGVVVLVGCAAGRYDTILLSAAEFFQQRHSWLHNRILRNFLLFFQTV
jgi:hypothetical protein